ncbi:MAG: [FeFe] hydrogenase H-cluster radical SAM maturase HydG [Armatimonadota bacterium]|nr:MAG: [FeFe] hydrogenase H-cluster radical SAM maturase HydG [Armatimonadota bacterium]
MQTQTIIKEKIDHILSDAEVENILEEGRRRSRDFALRALEDGKAAQGLTLEELAALAYSDDPEVLAGLRDAAHTIKKQIYGERMVFFAPLYISNFCSNNCLYCGFRHANKGLPRKALTPEEIAEEVRALLRQGHKRLLLVAGEDPRTSGIDYLERAVAAVYGVRENGASIRRVNVNCAPLSVEDFRRLKATQIGTYQVFQETYHRPTYKRVHPSGMKAHYEWRITAPDRAMEAGIDDIGVGVLFGLYDWRFEIVALLAHARYLETKFGVGPHTISVPRLEPAEGAPLSTDSPYRLTDDELKKVVSLLRVAVPYTGMILSTREAPELRDELFALGISQTSAGSRTTPGGYASADNEELAPTRLAQFTVQDHRSLAEMVRSFVKGEYIPSFCTACYRSGRTGDRFMALAKSGKIHDICQPNALASLKEYLLDYADEETRRAGEELIAASLKALPENLRRTTEKMLARLEAGERDVYL